MKIWVPGGDERMRALAELSGAEFGAPAPACYDAVALPLPDSTDMGLRIAEDIKEGANVMVGRADDALLRHAERRAWRLLRPQEDAEYTRANAVLSAEGALHAAMSKARFAMRGARCLVLGYGRIGKELARLLACLGADTAVFSRGEIACDAEYHKLSGLPKYLSAAQVVFNTIPARILPACALALLNQNALLLDLASPPYGFDLAEALTMGVRASREGGIPGAYAPITAARFILEYLERSAAE